MSRQDEQRLLVKIATLYYLEGYKQSDIAKTMSLSQSFVSRAINRSIKEGVVKISVVQPENMFINLEKAIQKKYVIDQAIVVDSDEHQDEAMVKRAIGSAAAHYLETRLRANDLIGISSWSSTIRAMVDQMYSQKLKASGVIQLLGGVGANGNVQATILTQTLAELLNCPSWLLPSQSIERSVDDKKRLLSSNEVTDVIKKFDDVNMAIVGIGHLLPSQFLRNSGNYYDQEMLDTLAKRGAVGDLCLHYFDQKGKPVLREDEDPVIGMALEKIRNCPQVVALAGGGDKVEAIKGALCGQYIDVLITDRVTAKQLL
ncbi:sugar-binding transcriptional regulator [Vibrio salinus]|uniref:sugar-binding transcriptional regulator n=1 Tax=Vibrio salinus TaxID=2899784 RepID=UPI001E31C148|nr:sugar-binding transcriptional regulator [Vibrio salinus]MCE0495993.1 sugar-binding transcriptional regulator [Vibrio salinus]